MSDLDPSAAFIEFASTQERVVQVVARVAVNAELAESTMEQILQAVGSVAAGPSAEGVATVQTHAEFQTTLDDQAAYAAWLARRAAIRERIAAAQLSHRHRQIAHLIAQGLTNDEIASKLFLSDKTVKGYVSTTLDKLHVKSRTELTGMFYDGSFEL